MKSSPRALQLEKARVQQRIPNAAKINKFLKIFLKLKKKSKMLKMLKNIFVTLGQELTFFLYI